MTDPSSLAVDYFLVLDFEATCEEKRRLVPQEIIEWPVVKVNAHTCCIEDPAFHQYIAPQAHPTVTPFCTQLTGITQVRDRRDGRHGAA
mmetsp:Transcript_36867/g.105640  ORF Transcript_36867/g.105640 Transcript_36867/m.105640 type:complete len:89 (+) Transcript_36867:85-351(+)